MIVGSFKISITAMFMFTNLFKTKSDRFVRLKKHDLYLKNN